MGKVSPYTGRHFTMNLRSHSFALTYDDVLIVPSYSNVLPNEVDTSTVIGGINLRIPIISSAMDTVTGYEMAKAIAEEGGIGVLHKNTPDMVQCSIVSNLKGQGLLVGAAVGIGDSGFSLSKSLVSSGVDLLCVDTAHGHSEGVLRAVSRIREALPSVVIMAGNVATPEAALSLVEAGANIIKVGIGPGSICTTRLVSGVGFPQLSALDDVSRICESTDTSLVADGGIRYSGDIAKAVAVGADAVMLGSLLAGTDESPGDVIESGGEKYKSYRGMGSIGAMKSGSSDRYFQDGTKKLVAEGVEAMVPYRGSVRPILHQLVGGLRSAMGYTGSHNLPSMKNRVEFVRVTANGVSESRVHSVVLP